MVERAEAKGGGGDAVLEEAAPRAAMGGAPQSAAPQVTLAIVPERTPEGMPAAKEAVSSKHALVSRPGEGRASGRLVTVGAGWAQ